jgi:ribose/xylose/arabinose/galactoside ABC-type transport system permease subunit
VDLVRWYTRDRYSVIALLGLVIAGELVLRRTVCGRGLYAIGGNLEAATTAGYNTTAFKTIAFATVGGLAAVAGLFAMAAGGSASPDIGTGWSLTVIAPVVVGGTSLFGGAGSTTGTLLGLLILQVVQSGLLSAGVEIYWSTISAGAIMILAVMLDLARRRGR